MQRIAGSQRLRALEREWNAPLTELFYNWHWNDNLKHAEIAKRIGLPRSTVTRWFQVLNIPSQPGARFTTPNLLNIGPKKTPPAKSKIKKIRPWKVNEAFFDAWSADVAYLLGFFCADGSMYKNPRGSCYISFEITDRELLLGLKNLLGSGHKLALKKRSINHPRWKESWVVQIGSKKIFNKLVELGVTPRKAKRLRMPDVPAQYVADFIRGYFDGDGGVYHGFTHKFDRKNPSAVLRVTFTSSSKGLLWDIARHLHQIARTTSKKPFFSSHAFRLRYGIADSRKIYGFMYNQGADLYLERKKVIFEKYMGA